jgi:hypothetical protein
MPEHEERPPSTLAHGPAKSSDIERVREDLLDAEKRLVQEEKASVARHARRVFRREARPKPDAPS